MSKVRPIPKARPIDVESALRRLDPPPSGKCLYRTVAPSQRFGAGAPKRLQVLQRLMRARILRIPTMPNTAARAASACGGNAGTAWGGGPASAGPTIKKRSSKMLKRINTEISGTRCFLTLSTIFQLGSSEGRRPKSSHRQVMERIAHQWPAGKPVRSDSRFVRTESIERGAITGGERTGIARCAPPGGAMTTVGCLFSSRYMSSTVGHGQ